MKHLSVALVAAPQAEQPSLLGPVIVILIIVLLNIAVVAVAFRLRRVFREIGGEGEDEQPAPND